MMKSVAEVYGWLWGKIVADLNSNQVDHIHLFLGELKEDMQEHGMEFVMDDFLAAQNDKSIIVRPRDGELLFYRCKLGPCTHN